MLVRQYDLQMSMGIDPTALRGKERGEYVTMNHTALIKELGEALDEIAWKPWSVDKDTFNREAYVKELVDAFHFLMNLLLVAYEPHKMVGIDDLAFEFFRLYIQKAEVNRQRAESGTYDGKATKCSDCGRAIEDGARRVLQDHIYQGTEYHAYTCICGRLNYLEMTGVS